MNKFLDGMGPMLANTSMTESEYSCMRKKIVGLERIVEEAKEVEKRLQERIELEIGAHNKTREKYAATLKELIDLREKLLNREVVV